MKVTRPKSADPRRLGSRLRKTRLTANIRLEVLQVAACSARHWVGCGGAGQEGFWSGRLFLLHLQLALEQVALQLLSREYPLGQQRDAVQDERAHAHVEQSGGSPGLQPDTSAYPEEHSQVVAQVLLQVQVEQSVASEQVRVYPLGQEVQRVLHEPIPEEVQEGGEPGVIVLLLVMLQSGE